MEGYYNKNDDSLKFILDLVRQYSPASKEENVELIRRVRMGDMKARELIICKNIYLVLKVLNKYKKKTQTFQKADLLQEGFLGLLKAIEGYDENLGSFYTYAMKAIYTAMIKSVRDNDNIISRSHIQIISKRKYRDYIIDLKSKGLPIPDDETIKKDLGISSEMLRNIRNDENFDTKSFSDLLSLNSEENNTLEETVGALDKGYDSLIDALVDEGISAFLKINYSKFEYYVLYTRFLTDEYMNGSEVARTLGMEPNEFRYYENELLKRLKGLFDESTWSFKGTVDKDTKRLLDLGFFVITPITLDQIVRFLFVRDSLDEVEIEIYKEKYFSNVKFSPKVVAKKLSLSEDAIKDKEASLEAKIERILREQASLFEEFKKNVLEYYKKDIFEVDLGLDVHRFKKSYRYTYDVWKDKSYEEFLEFMDGREIPHDLENKLKMFFGYNDPKFSRYSITGIEEKINCIIKGVFDSSDLSKTRLYNSYVKKRRILTPLQDDSLKVYFGKMTKEEFRSLHGDRTICEYADVGYMSLYSMYFNLGDYRHRDFDAIQYKRIKKHCKVKLSKECIRVLDFFFSYKGTDLYELVSSMLGIPLEDVNLKIQSLKTQAIVAYTGSSAKREGLEPYRTYLKNNKLDLKEPTNTLLRMFLFENKSYEEIAEALSIPTRKVSIIFTTALRRIDYSRFGIFDDFVYSEALLFECIGESLFSSEVKDALREYVKTADGARVTEKYGLSDKEIGAYMTKIKALAYKKTVDATELELYEIRREISCYETENVLSIQERTVLSLYYGIKNTYNPNGEKMNTPLIGKRFGLTSATIVLCKNKALDSIKAKKAKIAKAPYDFLKKSELESFLEDPAVPIDSDDISILKAIYGVGCTPCSLEEYSRARDENIKTLRARLYNAVCTLRKYQNGEIECRVVYETDVEPYLKYFTLHDRAILEDYYKNGFTYEKIQKKYGVTFSECLNRMRNMRVYLKNLQLGYPGGLDYDYYYAHVRDKDVPFYGDKGLAMQLFHLFYEENMLVRDIIEKYYPNLNEPLVRRYISYLSIAVMKHKEKVKKSFEYSYEEVRDYYLANYKNMSLAKRKAFYDYLKSSKNRYVSVKRMQPMGIINVMLKENEDYVHLRDLSHKEIVKLLETYRNKLSHREMDWALAVLGIHSREFMKGSDQRQVLKFLADVSPSLEKKYVIMPIEQD